MSFPVLPSRTYDVILADPPWMHYGDAHKDQAAGKHYSLVSDEELAALAVSSLAAPAAALFLWATCPRLDAAVDLMRRWGFYHRGVAFVWVKTRGDGGIISGQGVRPTVVKPTTELVLVGSRKKKGRPLPVADESVGQVVLAPRGAHSEKPAEVQRRIELLYPNTQRIELFARRRRCDWDAWGNEVPA